MHIRFVIHESTLGNVLVAGGETGLCAVLLGEDRDWLRDDLASRFPEAALLDGAGVLDALADMVVEFVETPSRELDVSLELHGTEFQQMVWQALRKIPLGSTASYTEIAQRIGRPKSVRAVAQACGANPMAVVIPCHRVVRSDGTLSGYRWGIERKRMLLQREAGA